MAAFAARTLPCPASSLCDGARRRGHSHFVWTFVTDFLLLCVHRVRASGLYNRFYTKIIRIHGSDVILPTVSTAAKLKVGYVVAVYIAWKTCVTLKNVVRGSVHQSENNLDLICLISAV